MNLNAFLTTDGIYAKKIFNSAKDMLHECEDEKFLYMFDFFERIYVPSPEFEKQFFDALQRRSDIINCHLRIDLEKIQDDDEVALGQMIEKYEKIRSDIFALHWGGGITEHLLSTSIMTKKIKGLFYESFRSFSRKLKSFF